MAVTDFKLVLFVINIMTAVELLWRFLWFYLEIVVKCILRRADNSVTGKVRFSKTVINIDEDDGMKNEWRRLETFVKFPDDSPISSLRLANNGFFFSGYEDLVKCFSCGAEHGKWKENDNAASVHAQISPNCRFVKGCSTNVPIHSPTNDGIPAVKVKNARYSLTVSSATNDEKTVHRTLGNVSAQTISDKERGASRKSTMDAPTSYGSRTNTENSFEQSSDSKTNKCNVNHTDNNLNITMVNHTVMCRKNGFEGAAENILPKAKAKYITFEARLNSFAKWPKGKTIDPGQLASAGMYYTGNYDIVACFACDVKIRNWEKGDDPYIVHARWFPHCPNLLDKKGHAFIERNQVVRPKILQVNTMKKEAFTSGTQEQRQCLVGNGDYDRSGEASLNAQNGINGINEGCERVLCKLCSKAKRNILFIPCRHVDVCETCAYIVPTCLTCNAEISDIQKFFNQ